MVSRELLVEGNFLKMEFRVTSLLQFRLAWIGSNTFLILAYMGKYFLENDMKQLSSLEITYV